MVAMVDEEKARTEQGQQDPGLGQFMLAAACLERMGGSPTALTTGRSCPAGPGRAQGNGGGAEAGGRRDAGTAIACV